jgi:hypothetical protein
MNIVNIIIFVVLIILFLGFFNQNVIENFTDEEYKNNAFILAQKNAANIQFLKEQIDGINTLKTEVLDLSNSVAFNTTNINKLTTATAHEANNLIGMPKDYGLPKSK